MLRLTAVERKQFEMAARLASAGSVSEWLRAIAGREADALAEAHQARVISRVERVARKLAAAAAGLTMEGEHGQENEPG
jgi:hypothetical protein